MPRPSRSTLDIQKHLSCQQTSDGLEHRTFSGKYTRDPVTITCSALVHVFLHFSMYGVIFTWYYILCHRARTRDGTVEYNRNRKKYDTSAGHHVFVSALLKKKTFNSSKTALVWRCKKRKKRFSENRRWMGVFSQTSSVLQEARKHVVHT